MNNYQKLNLYARKLAKYNQMGGKVKCDLCKEDIVDRIIAIAGALPGICSCMSGNVELTGDKWRIYILYTELFSSPIQIRKDSLHNEISYVTFDHSYEAVSLSTPHIYNDERTKKIIERAIQYFNTIYGAEYGMWNTDGTKRKP